MKNSDFNTNGFLSNEIEEWRHSRKIGMNLSYLLNIDLNRFAQKRLYDLVVHNKDVRELLMATFYIRFIGHYQGVITLVERGMLVEARIIQRSLLEVLFRATAIAKSEENAREFIEQDHFHQQGRIKKLIKLNANEILNSDLNALNAEYARLDKEIEERCYKRRTTYWFAERAGLQNFYYSAYASLSESVHSTSKDIQKYLVLDSTKEKVTSFKYGPDDSELELILLTNGNCMILFQKALHEVFDLEENSDLNQLIQRFENLSEQKRRNRGT